MLLNRIATHPVRLHSSAPNRNITLSLTSLILIVLSSACSDTGVSSRSDTNNAPPATENANTAIASVAGTWNLPGNWKGLNNDKAYLVIRTPTDGIADAIVYDYDDASTGLGNNCYYIDGAEGTVTVGSGTELLLDLSTFPDASVSVQSGNLTIEYTVGPETGSSRETTTLVASRTNIAETDLQPICEF